MPQKKAPQSAQAQRPKKPVAAAAAAPDLISMATVPQTVPEDSFGAFNEAPQANQNDGFGDFSSGAQPMQQPQ